MKKVLLHICCGVCAFGCISHLKEEGFYVEGFFYNPNIYPQQEYIKRKDAAYRVCEITQTTLKEGLYEPKIWQNACTTYENEPEGGKRCNLCYELRLRELFNATIAGKFDFFATTLSVSPHKNSDAIIDAGKNIDPARFLAIDFKKNDGFKKTIALAKEYNIYRQNYCGCVYSIR